MVYRHLKSSRTCLLVIQASFHMIVFNSLDTHKHAYCAYVRTDSRTKAKQACTWFKIFCVLFLYTASHKQEILIPKQWYQDSRGQEAQQRDH